MDETDQREHEPGLAALEMADEVPCEDLTVAVVLGDQILRPILGHQRHAGVGQDTHLIEKHVLGDEHHFHAAAGASGRRRGGGDSLFDFGQALAYAPGVDHVTHQSLPSVLRAGQAARVLVSWPRAEQRLRPGSPPHGSVTQATAAWRPGSPSSRRCE